MYVISPFHHFQLRLFQSRPISSHICPFPSINISIFMHVHRYTCTRACPNFLSLIPASHHTEPRRLFSRGRDFFAVSTSGIAQPIHEEPRSVATNFNTELDNVHRLAYRGLSPEGLIRMVSLKPRVCRADRVFAKWRTNTDFDVCSSAGWISTFWVIWRRHLMSLAFMTSSHC